MAGSDVFTTVNGTQTVDSMRQQLVNAGWDGRGTIQDAYARTTGGPVQFVGGETGVSAAGAHGSVIQPGTPQQQQQQQQKQPGVDLGAIQQAIVNALATGNKAAFDETVRQFNQTFGLDQNKFNEAVRQFNQTFTLQQAGVTGMYNGAPTEAHRQFDVTTGLNAAQLAASLHTDPFRQREVEGQLGRLLKGQGVAGFQAPTGSAADSSSIDYLLNQIRNPAASTSNDATLNAIPAPNQVSAPDFFRSSPGTQNLLLSGIKAKYGLDPEDALAQIRRTLPGFTAPTTTGRVLF